MSMIHVVLVLATLTTATSSTSGPKLPASLDLTAIRALPLQHNGRWPPLDTVARDTVESVTGAAFFQGHDPVLLLLAWTFDAPSWTQQPLIRIRNAELRAELQLPATQTVFSYTELLGHAHLRNLIGELSRIERGRKLDPLQNKVSDINDKLLLLQSIFGGRVIRPIPDPEDTGAAWQPIPPSTAGASADVKEVQDAWEAVRSAFLQDDDPAFASGSTKLLGSLAKLPATYHPEPKRIALELRYNRLHPFRTAWEIMAIGAVLAAMALGVRSRWFDVLAFVGTLTGFVLLSYGLWMRWKIAGRIPASNMFESLLFLSWGMGAFAIVAVFVLRHRLVQLTAAGMGAVALLLADVLPLDPYIRPIVPVLRDTVWMSIHVPVIMVSYSVLALGVLIAHVQLITMAAAPARHRLVKTLDILHYWYIHVGSILLLAGIVTGSMWAASSWGRYWGWDPKEVWSLVALVGYLTILHVRIDHEKRRLWAYVVGLVLVVALFVLVVPKLGALTAGRVLALGGTALAMVLFVAARGRFATALKSIVCFWLILMTYLGVNYVLGIGLHSYGFGTGAVARHMLTAGTIDLGLMGLCTAVYLVRRRQEYPASAVALPVLDSA